MARPLRFEVRDGWHHVTARGNERRAIFLNPVRTRRLGLAKTQRAEAEQGCQAPSPEVVGERLWVLRAFRWSSYRAYAGYAAAPPWLKTQEVLGRYGGNAGEQRARHRDHVESAVRQGLERRPWENVMESAVLGTAAFVGSIRGRLRAMRGEGHRIKREWGQGSSLDTIQEFPDGLWPGGIGRYRSGPHTGALPPRE